VRLPEGCDQRRAMQRMLDLGVSTRRGIMCVHREPAGKGARIPRSLHRSEEAQDRCILIPLYPQMTVPEQDRVAEALEEACRKP
jgi:perosamine synthetase